MPFVLISILGEAIEAVREDSLVGEEIGGTEDDEVCFNATFTVNQLVPISGPARLYFSASK